MPLPGGSSDKAGNRYELIWTASCMVRILRGEAESIYLERPDEKGEGIEFSVRTDTGTEYHQVKRQLTGRGVWSLKQLASSGVLANFYQRLGDPQASCFFISSHAAHPLDELAYRARQAGSFRSFKKNFVNSQQWDGNFKLLHRLWNSPTEEDSYDRLNRIHIRTVSEGMLRESVEYGLETQITGNSANVLSALMDFALDQLNQDLSQSDILNFLRSREFEKQTWAQQQGVTDAVTELNETYRSGMPPVDIGGTSVPREEVNKILEAFDDSGTENVALVSGRAGVGKTSTISQVLDSIGQRGWPMLLLRVDRLEATPTPAQLGHSLGLPASPASVLAALAQGRDCLLVIDQMDAVSLASGRNPQFFDCIGALLHQARRHPNMKVLTACRKFDIDNDYRMKELVKDGGIAIEVPLSQFDKPIVKSLVAELGLDPGRLSSKQLELLRLPIHLKLLAESLSENPEESMGFQTATDLYDRFWDEKRSSLRERIDPTRMQQLIDLIIDDMARRQALFVPVGLLDGYNSEVAVLVSENILVRDGSSVSFFHEGFFDYIFARWFVSTDLDLVDYISEQEQSLFVRSQVRQVLLHQRDTSMHDFCLVLDSVLSSPCVRTHLKTIALSLLGSFNDPTEEEWNILEPLLDSELSRHVLGALHNSIAWFDLIERIGVIQKWLESSDEQLQSRVLWLVAPLLEERSSKIAKLLTPYVGASESWNRRLADLYLRSDCLTSKEFFNFSRELIDAGALDDLLMPEKQDDVVWMPLKRGTKSRPEWVAKMILRYLQRSMELTEGADKASPFPSMYRPTRSGQEVIADTARSVPEIFLDLLLPLVCEIVEANADEDSGSPRRDEIWGLGLTGMRDGLESAFILAIESSLAWSACNNPDEFGKYAKELKASEFHTMQNLLVRAYAAGGKPYADDAIEYLLEDPKQRFGIGKISTSVNDAIHVLLDAATPYCSLNHLHRLEDSILEYYPFWEEGADSRKIRGAGQWQLLESIDASHLSEKALRRLKELRRKFSDLVPSVPGDMEGGFVGPPIPDPLASKMTDDQWLRAIDQHSSDRPRLEPDKFLIGGAHEQAQVLERLTKEDPERFARLIHRIPDHANSAYFNAILRGLTGAGIGMESVVAACLRCHDLTGRPLGRWITQPLAHVIGSHLPNDALEMIVWYATNDPDPDPTGVSSSVTYYQAGQEGVSYDPISVGINSVRGAAAGSIARLIFQDEWYLSYFRPHLKKMVSDSSEATLACVMEVLVAILRYDRDMAVELFLKLCSPRDYKWRGFAIILPKWMRENIARGLKILKRRFCPFRQDLDDRLLATYHAEMFLRHATQTHFRQLKPLLSFMLRSRLEEVATEGARLVCYASLTDEDASRIARRCTSGTVSQRKGVASVYAANLKYNALRLECEDAIGKLFADSDPEVRRQAARCFDGFEGRDLEDYRALATKFTYSLAFETQANPLFRALENTTADIPGEILAACERVFELAGEETTDISTATAGTSSIIAKLIVRVYSRTDDATIRSLCLDLIDKMALLRAYGFETVTDAFERE